MFPEVKPRVTSRFEGNKINCFPRDQSYGDLYIADVLVETQLPLVQGVRTKKIKIVKFSIIMGSVL